MVYMYHSFLIHLSADGRISLFDLSFGRTSLEHTEAFSKKSIFRFYTEITKRPSLKCLFVKLYTTFCEDLEGCGVVYFYLGSVLGTGTSQLPPPSGKESACHCGRGVFHP